MLRVIVRRSGATRLLERTDPVAPIERTRLLVGLDESVGERGLVQLVFLFGPAADHAGRVLPSEGGLGVTDGSVDWWVVCGDY